MDSNSGLVFDWPMEKIPKQSAGTDEAVQSASAAMSGTLLATGAQAPMEVEQGEEEIETGEVAEVSRPTLEELAMAVACTLTTTPMTIYSTTVNVSTPTPIPTTPSFLMLTSIYIESAIVTAPTPTPVPIYSLVTSVSQVPLTLRQ